MVLLKAETLTVVSETQKVRNVTKLLILYHLHKANYLQGLMFHAHVVYITAVVYPTSLGSALNQSCTKL